ncbi:MAG: Fic family protein [Coriobacteriales bacterium]|jgi:Fic family protein|nr:Fic family protein [Coriobacteriales bacterium]
MTSKPPYTITVKTADYLTKIAETVTRLEYGTGFKRNIKLHRKNRVRSIHSSLAIEGNTLSLDEVTDVIGGKLIAGKQAEVKEVKNAYEAYDRIMTFDPYAVKDFLKAHKLMTDGLVKESGRFRNGDVGVFDGEVLIHAGARPQFVPQLIEELFKWAKDSELHPVLKSAIVHCEIETIHPFADGNGRMGRLWQTLILAKWNEIFAWIPMESLVYEKRPQYYDALQNAQNSSDSGEFIEFTLSAILGAVEAQTKHQDKHQDKHQVELNKVMLSVLRSLEAISLSRKEIFAVLNMSGDTRAFRRYIEPLLSGGYIEMTVLDKPNSKLQKYRLTDKGKAAIR